MTRRMFETASGDILRYWWDKPPSGETVKPMPVTDWQDDERHREQMEAGWKARVEAAKDYIRQVKALRHRFSREDLADIMAIYREGET